MKRIREERAKTISESKSGSWVNPDLEELDRIVDEDGYSTTPETVRGTVLEVGTYLGGGIGIMRGLGRLAVNSPRAATAFARKHRIKTNLVEGTAIGTATDQWISNPNEENLTPAILDAFDVPDSALLGIGEYLAGEEADSDLTKRTKMLLGNLPADLVLGGILGWKSESILARYGKSADDLTAEELGEAGLRGLDRTKRE